MALQNPGYRDTIFPEAEAHPLGETNHGTCLFSRWRFIFLTGPQKSHACAALLGLNDWAQIRGPPTSRPTRASCRTGHTKVRALRTGGHPTPGMGVVCVQVYHQAGATSLSWSHDGLDLQRPLSESPPPHWRTSHLGISENPPN